MIRFITLDRLRQIVIILISLFPLTVAGVPHGGSLAYLALFFISLFGVKGVWGTLGKSERQIFFGLLIFFLVVLLSTVNTENFVSAHHKLDRYLRLLFAISIFLFLINKRFELHMPIVTGLCGGSLLLFSEAIYEVNIIGREFAEGAYHKIIFGDTAVLLAGLLVVAMITIVKRSSLRIILGVLVFFSIYASILSMTRSAWVFVFLLPFFLAWMLRKHFLIKQWLQYGVGALVIIVSVSPFVYSKVKSGLESGIDDLRIYERNPNTSLGERINMWRDAWTMFKTSPLLGIGTGDYMIERKKLENQGRANKSPDGGNYGHAHNQYIHILATTGILGFCTMLAAVFILPWRYFYKTWISAKTDQVRFYSLGGMVFLLAFMVFGLAETWLGRHPLVNQYGFYLAVFMAGIVIEKHKAPSI